VAGFAQRDGVAFFLTRDSVACTIGMNAPHNPKLGGRGFCCPRQPGKCLRSTTIGNDNSLAQIKLILSLKLND
jgi:hypothetical protein